MSDNTPASKRIPKLHELLAVEQERKATADKARRACLDRFTKNTNHFTGLRRTYRPFSVDESQGEVAGERLEAETRLVATVVEVLRDTLQTMTPSLDVSLQVDEANTRARADIVVGEHVIARDVPATYLLQLEKRLRSMRDVFSSAQTRDPVKLWSLDTGADKPHVYRSEPVATVRKKRTRKYNIMVEATKEHPAQVDIVEVDKPTGELRSYEWSGMISPGIKSQLLERMDQLILAVKAARSRANTAPIKTDLTIGKAISEYLFEPISS